MINDQAFTDNMLGTNHTLVSQLSVSAIVDKRCPTHICRWRYWLVLSSHSIATWWVCSFLFQFQFFQSYQGSGFIYIVVLFAVMVIRFLLVFNSVGIYCNLLNILVPYENLINYSLLSNAQPKYLQIYRNILNDYCLSPQIHNC